MMPNESPGFVLKVNFSYGYLFIVSGLFLHLKNPVFLMLKVKIQFVKTNFPNGFL